MTQINTAEEIISSLKKNVGPILEKGSKLFAEGVNTIGMKLKEEIIPTVISFFEGLFKSQNITVEEVEMLSSEKLVELCKKYIVEGSNQVAAFKEFKKDNFYVYLAYCKDRELIDEEHNHYIVIIADGLSKDVKELFGESDLVILN